MALNIPRELELRNFWPSNQPLRILAAQWNMTESYISQQAKRLGLPSRKYRVREIRAITHLEKFNGRVEAHEYFVNEASKRGITPSKLERLLISVISNDHMVDAILDD